MSNNPLIDKLAGELKPVRPRNARRQAAWLLALAAVELAAFLSLGTMRPDIGTAVGLAVFWWKIGSLALLALAGTAIAVQSFEPSASPRRGLRRWWGLAALALLLGWAVDPGGAQAPPLLARLNWHMGLECLATMVALSIPPVGALGILMRSGAPTDRARSALAAGAGGATWGALIFAFHCPSDDPLYIAIWYTLGCGIVMGFARMVLPRLTRW